MDAYLAEVVPELAFHAGTHVLTQGLALAPLVLDGTADIGTTYRLGTPGFLGGWRAACGLRLLLGDRTGDRCRLLTASGAVCWRL